MSQFWEIISKWEPFGQGIFFLSIFWAFCQAMVYTSKYIAVAIKGWPDNIEEEE